MAKFVSHYKWLDQNFPKFCAKIGVDFETRCKGIVTCHADKCYGYESYWKDEHSISFEHGVAIFLLSYLKPWSELSRVDENGKWKNVKIWVAEQYPKFKSI